MFTLRIPLFLNPLFFILLAIVFLNYNLLTRADESLIKQQCHNAEVPEVCIRCVVSDPRAKKANEIGIAMIIVTNCLINQSKLLANNMTSLTAIAPYSIRPALKDCNEGYVLAGNNLVTAGKKLKSGDYDIANHYIGTALYNQLMCRANITYVGQWELPVTVAFEMNIYELLSDAAMRIIDRF